MDHEYEDHRLELGRDYLSIKTDDWHLMKAFKEACEDMGWKYCTNFTQFTQETFETMKKNNRDHCMYFSYEFDNMEGQPAFALSNSGLTSYLLPHDWKSALKAAKSMLEHHSHLYRVELNEDYTAVVDTKRRLVRVGCQEFEFDKVLEIANLINKNKTK